MMMQSRSHDEDAASCVYGSHSWRKTTWRFWLLLSSPSMTEICCLRCGENLCLRVQATVSYADTDVVSIDMLLLNVSWRWCVCDVFDDEVVLKDKKWVNDADQEMACLVFKQFHWLMNAMVFFSKSDDDFPWVVRHGLGNTTWSLFHCVKSASFSSSSRTESLPQAMYHWRNRDVPVVSKRLQFCEEKIETTTSGGGSTRELYLKLVGRLL